MADPSNYVSFADYLGLNDEAGQQMLSRTMEGSDKLRSEAEAATAARFNAAKGGTAAYEASGERERKALASYGDFMAGLSDPAKRQAMMEKAYGKGAVSALDSAFAGAAGGGRISAGQQDAQGMRRAAESSGIRDANRANQYQRMGDQQAANEKSYAADLQRRRDAQAAMLRKRADADENKRIDLYARQNIQNPMAYNGDEEYWDPIDTGILKNNQGKTNREVARERLAAEEKRRGQKFYYSGSSQAEPSSGWQGTNYVGNAGAPAGGYWK